MLFRCLKNQYISKYPSYVLRPVTPSNAPSSMSYRNCWHIFSPRLLSFSQFVKKLFSRKC